MVVFCPGCGIKIDAQPNPEDTQVSCPRCSSTFFLDGVNATAGPTPKPKLRKKKVGGGKALGFFILLMVLLVLGGGTAGVLYYTSVIGSRSTGSVSGGTPPSNSGTAALPAGWKDFENSEAKFSARFPGTPKRSQRMHPRPTGPVRDVAFEVENGGIAYGVVYADLDQPGLRGTTPEQYIEQQQTNHAKSGKLQSEKPIALGSHKGREFVVEVPNQGTAHMRIYAAGRRLYSVLVVGKNRSPAPNEVAALFDSFRILD